MNKFSVITSGASEIGARASQQDAVIVLKRANRILAVLSDGMGGMEDGDKFSCAVVDAFKSCFEQMERQEDLSVQLCEMYQKAKEEALKQCVDPEKPEGGATVVAVMIEDDRCSFLSAGDSRLYLYRGGALFQLNREQTLGIRLDVAAAMGYIRTEDAKSNFRRKVLYNEICNTEGVLPDYCPEPFRLVEGDRLLLMSDGVFSTLSERNILRCIRPGEANSVERITALIEKAQKPDQDNYSIVELTVTREEETT